MESRLPPPKKMREKREKKNKGIKNKNQGVERVGYCLLRVPSDVLIELENPA